MNRIYTTIIGTGKYIPTECVPNEEFITYDFLETTGAPIEKSNQDIIDKFQEITTIAERRYVTDDLVTSDIATFAALEAIKSAEIDKEDLDYVIMAHNFGDVRYDVRKTDIVPSLASRVKYKLGIENPKTVAYDVIFGCPGWLQGVIQADYYIKSGDAKKILVIGAEVLSRIADPHDRDSMIYSDGAGAVILEGKESVEPTGILAKLTRSDTLLHSGMLHMGVSYDKEDKSGDLFLKMNGRKLYQYALENVPQSIKDCLDKAGIHISRVRTVLIHQANGKMDDAIISRLFKLYGLENIPEDIMPMTISKLGNSSVATIPTLLDILKREEMKPYKINKDDILVFASVGAGMNINAVIYKV